MSTNEAMLLESTSKIEDYSINHNPYTRCIFTDFPGNFEVSQMNSIERKYLQNAHILLYVLDAKDEPYNRTLEKFLTLESEVYEMNPYCCFALLIHKLDGEMFATDESKLCVFNEVSELVRLNSSERSIPTAEIHMTSILDLSIYVSLSKILQKCTPMLAPLQDLLDLFISECVVDKVYIIDIVSKLFIATDSTPVDFLSYDLCCQMIGVTLGISTLYG